MNRSDIKPDLPVIITPYRDLMFLFDLRPYITTDIYDPLVFPVVKLTKGGLVQIQVEPNKTVSVPPSNVELWDVNDITNRIIITETFISLVRRLEV